MRWEAGGFVLYYKRLEQGTFTPSDLKKGELTYSDLVLMIEGIQVVKSIQKKRFFMKPRLGMPILNGSKAMGTSAGTG